MQEFEYELGLSFLSQDEKLADRLNEELNNYTSIYYYREHEREQVFESGTELYNQMFSQKVKFIIVLYREEWGKRGITSVEKTAIKSVLIDEQRGIDYILLVSLDEKRPKWWGDKISFNYEESKFSTLVEIILFNYKRIGGEINEVDPIQKIQRLRELNKKKDEKIKFLTQNDGKAIELLHKEFNSLMELFKIKIAELGNDFNFHIEEGPIVNHAVAPAYLIYTNQTTNQNEKFRIFVYLHRTNWYSIKDYSLTIFAGYPVDINGSRFSPTNKFKFTVDNDLKPGWKFLNDDELFYSSKEVLKILFVELQNYLEKESNPNDNSLFPGNMYIGDEPRSRANRF